MNRISTSAFATFALLSFSTVVNAETFTPTFSYVGAVTTGPGEQSGVYQADLSVFPTLDEIAAITITDDNSGTSGSAGAYSGFDLDALFIDLDGDYNTVFDQTYASSFLFTPGTIRPGTAPLSGTSGPLNGMNADGTVNEAYATLNLIDADYFGPGSISLGDGGSLTALFDPAVTVGSSLFLIAAEVGDNGEGLNASITVSEEAPNPVPLPAAVWLFGSALMGVAGVGYRRKKKAA